MSAKAREGRGRGRDREAGGRVGGCVRNREKELFMDSQVTGRHSLDAHHCSHLAQVNCCKNIVWTDCMCSGSLLACTRFARIEHA
jgi:hypothetical protein